MLPISRTETEMVKTFKSFPRTIEFAASFIGIDCRSLSHVLMPEFIIGIDQERVLEHQIKITGPTYVVLAIDASTRSVGVQVFTAVDHHKGIKEGFCQFIPIDRLILNKPLLQYLPPHARAALFGGIKDEHPCCDEIREVLNNHRDTRTLTQFTKEGTLEDIRFLPEARLRLDMFGTWGSVYPSGDYHQQMFCRTSFTGGDESSGAKLLTAYTHIHPQRTSKELEVIFREEPWWEDVYNFDPRHSELISTQDARVMMNSESRWKRWFGVSAQEVLVGVNLMEPATGTLLSSKYFDVAALSDNDKAFRQFTEATNAAHESSNADDYKRFFTIVRQFSTSERPEYARG
jgi:hypothetical protein